MDKISAKNIKKIFFLSLYSGLVLAGIYILIKLSLFLAPFLIALLISSLMEPLIKLVMKKTKLSREAASLCSILAVLLSAGIILVFIISKLISEAYNIYVSLPEYYSKIHNSLNLIIDKLHGIHLLLPHELSVHINNLISDLSSTFVGALSSVIKIILDTAVSIPDVIVFIMVTILSTYFMASDRDKLVGIIYRTIPKSIMSRIHDIKNDMFSVLLCCIKVQAILMCITFAELSIGFSFIGIKSPILLSLIISSIDALPIFGTGIMLIPWSIYCFMAGELRLAVSILIIFTIVFIVRQLIEPKILSRQTGIHPLLTMIGMYIGLKLFGVIGLMLSPMILLMLKSIFTQGLAYGKSSGKFIIPPKNASKDN